MKKPTSFDNAAANTYNVAEDVKKSQTGWDELRAVGKNAIEASSTTYAKNSRYMLFVDNDLKTPQEFDNLVTKEGALYQMQVQPGENISDDEREL